MDERDRVHDLVAKELQQEMEGLQNEIQQVRADREIEMQQVYSRYC